MKLKIFKKLYFTTSGVLLITLTLVFVFFSLAFNEATAKSKSEILNNSCNVVSSVVAETHNNADISAATILNSLSTVNDIDIFVADQHGRITLCGCDDYINSGGCSHTTIILGDNFLKNVSADGNFELSSIDGIYEGLQYTVGKKVVSDSEYYVFAASDVLTATDLLKTLLGMYAVAAVFPLIFMFIAEYSLVYRLTRPLKYMSIAAKSIAQGDFSKRVPVVSNDEIGELSVLFNRMTESLSRSEKTGKSFVANVSHELKTPMTTISGFIDGIIDGTIDDKKRDYYLKIVSDEVKRLARLVQSMLSLSRLESDEKPLRLTDVRLADTVVNVVVSMEQKISGKEINITGLDELSQTVISGDADLLHQVIYNLTDNAVKFTPYGGCINFNLHRIQDSVEFKISNTGDGIPGKDIPFIFERFYKIDKSRSTHKDSLGLGLYICKTVAELHNGTIKVESDSKTYTEFTVTLPIKNQ